MADDPPLHAPHPGTVHGFDALCGPAAALRPDRVPRVRLGHGPDPLGEPKLPGPPAASEGGPARPQAYGHAPDYRWLEGTLDVHHRGFRALRYADLSAEDRYGGKVRLADDERLRAFADGDVLR